MRFLKLTGIAATALLLTACAEKSSNIYYWGDYQSSLYGFYNNSAPEKDIATLSAVIEQAKAKNKAVPPGLYAQLGLLYVNTGQPDLAFQQFTAEKTAFPESSSYMDFLMRNKQGAK